MKKVVKYLALVLLLSCLLILKPANAIDIQINNFNIDINPIYLSVKDSFIKAKQKNEYPCMPRSLEELQGKKLIAFTFDDGPNNPTTLKLLEGLEKYNARVTFFVLGSRVNTHKKSLIKAYEQCNQIGNHTYNHYNLLKKNDKIIANEISSTNEAIYNIIGEYPTIIRTPYGNTNSQIKKIGNLPTISWSIDTLDWKYRNAEKIADKIIKNAEDGAIILLHDLYSTSVEGALIAMEELSDEYAFITIEEMMILKNINADINDTYYKFE